MKRLWILPSLALVAACKEPPPAPEGLDASTSYMIRNFYTDDPTFQAGVQGFIAWYEEEGFTLVGEQATAENTGSFTIARLTPDDVAGLPLDPQVLTDPRDETYEDRDLDRAPGVVSLADMACPWQTAEEYLVRPDQHVVFSDDFEGYERTYLGDRDAFEGAAVSGEFDEVRDPLTPFADGFDDAATARTLLRTDNVVDPTVVLVANLEPYPMHLDVRHGIFDVNGVETGAFAILTWIESAAWGSGGDNALIQSYSIEINVAQDDRTLRMLAVWTEPKGGGIEPDSNLALNFAVNKSLKSSERLSAVCAGEEEL